MWAVLVQAELQQASVLCVSWMHAVASIDSSWHHLQVHGTVL
jgi:hypothetical protein